MKSIAFVPEIHRESSAFKPQTEVDAELRKAIERWENDGGKSPWVQGAMQKHRNPARQPTGHRNTGGKSAALLSATASTLAN